MEDKGKSRTSSSSDKAVQIAEYDQQWSIGGLRQSVRKFRKEQVRREIRRAVAEEQQNLPLCA